MKQSIPYLFLTVGFMILFLNCKDRSVTPPEPTIPEINGIELNSEHIIVNDSVLITATLSEELGEEYALKWNLKGYQAEIDSITSETIFLWKAPKVHGNYEHSVQVLSTAGEPVSNPEMFSTEISSIPVVPVEGNKLVFIMQAIDGTNEVFSMNIDGSELEQLTFIGVDSEHASWSPDGKHIVFTSFYKSTSAGPVIYLMNSDGTNLRAMKPPEDSTSGFSGGYPKWSPDGTMITFSSSGFLDDIMIYDFEMDSVVRIAENSFQDRFPFWNPESNRIAFQSRRDTNPADSTRLGNDLYVMDIDGGNVQRLTETGSSRAPVWHPQNNIVVYRETNGSNKLMTVDVTTKMTMKIQEPFEEGVFLWPMAWSSGGEQLLVQVFDMEKYTFHILDLNTALATKIPLESESYTSIDWYHYQE